MSLTAEVVKRNIGMGWLVAAMTLVSIVISVGMVAGVLLVFYGPDAARGMTVGEYWGFAMGFAVVVPAIACPVVGTQMLMLLRELNKAREELARLANTDQLTQLLNRRGFELAANEALLEAERSGQPLAVLMCDIDHFKQINDNFGHDFGDQSIKHVAAVLADAAAQHGAIACRHGGEEFVMLLPGSNEGKARYIAESLRLACSASSVVWADMSARLTVSVGVSFASTPQTDLGRMMVQADSALYKAKQAGRDRVISEQLDVLALAA